MWRIAGDTGVHDLDSSSPYLLWRRDFSGTSVVARDGHGRTPGSITGYLPPEHPQTSVVRQVAFDEDLFPKGLGHEPEVLYRNDPPTRPNSPKDVPQ
ncbi:hypothetical protein QNO09_03345 [Streptomyces sp. 378]|uniref:hypothetical protein n=1 Tax=Streptomyces sp. 378 TaxID=3049412 RepID=UPI0024C20CDE|nr:hypothetical protein [Streptomyces sp. 378]MDK1342360.1 hypothetical protein [Streptomyces sp. 378]